MTATEFSRKLTFQELFFELVKLNIKHNGIKGLVKRETEFYKFVLKLDKENKTYSGTQFADILKNYCLIHNLMNERVFLFINMLYQFAPNAIFTTSRINFQ